ncbi:hypothetical protein AVEN_108206-1 [Araneus ventricosus]|uniref:Uncharacterized protein n=1 Tax=Araneus ventricosus TaxID=182803 RepID=A0A4Y2I397_ARAVE|nr:hypothetical protein AVEN_108206-1 [Araneus ventricosus]
MVLKKDNTHSKRIRNEALKKNYFLKTDLQLENTSEEFSIDDPLLASQSLLSNPHNGITMPNTPKQMVNAQQKLLRALEKPPNIPWPTTSSSINNLEKTQQNKKTKILHQENENSDSQMGIDSNLYKSKLAETEAYNCLRIGKDYR